MSCSERLSCSLQYDLISESAIPHRQRALVARSARQRFRGTLSNAFQPRVSCHSRSDRTGPLAASRGIVARLAVSRPKVGVRNDWIAPATLARALELSQ